MENQPGLYQIRPSGRLLETIGKDLIKDKYAAIVELVKNAYDADSSFCKISFKPFVKPHKGITIEISDSGHGMSFDTVINKWMVPATSNKLDQKKSPEGRVMQGRKGIGRYAASILGEDLILQTTTNSGEQTSLSLNWEEISKSKYLDEINILIESTSVTEPVGTTLIISGSEIYFNDWDKVQYNQLRLELKKLKSPIKHESDEFKIILQTEDLNGDTIEEEIKPFPLLDLYDYRIKGSISRVGDVNLSYENAQVIDAPVENIGFQININPDDYAYCGELNFDFRIYDRDPKAIDNLIYRGLKDPLTNTYVKKNEAKDLLNKSSGIGVYRNGFRIRPLGDAGFDWLELDRKRVQDPSKKIGSNQIIGYIQIESEESSGLYEKSARDGLKEDKSYYGLKYMSECVLLELETRRFQYRKSVGLGRSEFGLEKKLNRLNNFDQLKNKIKQDLSAHNISESTIKTVLDYINEEEIVSQQLVADLRQAIARYQGQATLGKIIEIVLHEGRKPLAYFNTQVRNINVWISNIKKEPNEIQYEKILTRLNTIGEQSSILVELFKKIDPLSSKRNAKKSIFDIVKLLESSKTVFETELNLNDISLDIHSDCETTLLCWKEDFYMLFTNLIENSIYWLKNYSREHKEIQVSFISENENELSIIYKDNGPGINKSHIDSNIIFEPGFSAKPSGSTGLGLSIAGEAVSRNNGELSAIYSEEGALFVIKLVK